MSDLGSTSGQKQPWSRQSSCASSGAAAGTALAAVEGGRTEPYLHSDHAVCIRDSEGSFAERRTRLDGILGNRATRADLMQRNIVQGVNIIRRGAHTLEGLLLKRPRLDQLISAGRFSPDYLDQAFPTDPAHSIAPLAERKAQVSLASLLGSPVQASSSASAGAPRMPVPLPPGTFSAASKSTPLTIGQPGALPRQGAPLPGALDPAVLAAMMMQMTSMPRPMMPPGPGATGATGQMPLSGRMPPVPSPGMPLASMTLQGVPFSGATPLAPQVNPPRGPVPVAQPRPLGPGEEVATSLAADGSSPSPRRQPKPSLQAVREPFPVGAKIARTPFVQLLDDFCTLVQERESAKGDARGFGTGIVAPPPEGPVPRTWSQT